MSKKSKRKLYDEALARHEKIAHVVWELCEAGNLRFSEGLKLATDEQVREYHAAITALVEAEQAAISAGKAWRSSIGGLHWK